MSKVIIVNTPGPQGPRGPGGIYEGSGPLTISGSVSATSSFWNIVTQEFQVVTDPVYLTNQFFLIKNQYNEFRIGTLPTETAVRITTESPTALTIQSASNEVFLLTREGIAYFTAQTSLPDTPINGGLLFSGSDFFVSS